MLCDDCFDRSRRNRMDRESCRNRIVYPRKRKLNSRLRHGANKLVVYTQRRVCRVLQMKVVYFPFFVIVVFSLGIMIELSKRNRALAFWEIDWRELKSNFWVGKLEHSDSYEILFSIERLNQNQIQFDLIIFWIANY